MHTDTTATTEQNSVRLRHRHFLAIPLFAAFVTVLVLLNDTRVQATLLPTVSLAFMDIRGNRADAPFSLESGMYGVVREDGVLANHAGELTLEEGTMLLGSQGLSMLRIHDVTLHAFHGGFLTMKSGEKVTVLALTSPILLTRSEFRMVIPMGMQMSWSAMDALPSTPGDAVLAEQTQALARINENLERQQRAALALLTPAALPAFDDAMSPSPLLQSLALPLAEARMDREQTLARLTRLRIALHTGDALEARKILADPALSAMLDAPEVNASALPILFAESTIPSINQELLDHIADPALWLLLSLHPEYAGAAWSSVEPLGMPPSARTLRLLSLPVSNIRGEGLPALVLDGWRKTALLSLKFGSHPEAFVSALLRILPAYRTYIEQHGFAEREKAIADALHDFHATLKDPLSAEDEAMYQAWQAVNVIVPYSDPPPAPVVAEPVPAAVSSSSSSSPEQFVPVEVEAEAQAMLKESGIALFTAQTVFRAVSAHQVEVTGLLLATMETAHVYNFTLDTTAKTVSNIQRDGEASPYGISLEALFKWAKTK